MQDRLGTGQSDASQSSRQSSPSCSSRADSNATLPRGSRLLLSKADVAAAAIRELSGSEAKTALFMGKEWVDEASEI